MNNPKTKSFAGESKDSFVEGMKKGLTEGVPSFLLLLKSAVVHSFLLVVFVLIDVCIGQYSLPEILPKGLLDVVRTGLAYGIMAWFSHAFILDKSSKRARLLAVGWILASSPILLLPWGNKPIVPERFRFF